MTRRYGRAAPGQRVPEAVPSARGTALSTIAALGLDGLRASLSVRGAVDGEVMQFFVQQVLAPQLQAGEVVVWDNAAIHTLASVPATLAAVGARLEFLPTYSPDFNPIELCWSKLKTLMRADKPRTHAELVEALHHAMDQVTPQDIAGWFEHCGYTVAPK